MWMEMWKMVYKQYNYCGQKQKITKLLRKRLLIMDKIRYHKNKVRNFEEKELPEIEEAISKLLEMINRKV